MIERGPIVMPARIMALVPIQQAEIFIARLKGVSVPAELVVKKGAGHGWPNMDKDWITIADWFDKHLKPGAPH